MNSKQKRALIGFVAGCVIGIVHGLYNSYKTDFINLPENILSLISFHLAYSLPFALVGSIIGYFWFENKSIVENENSSSINNKSIDSKKNDLISAPLEILLIIISIFILYFLLKNLKV